MVYAGIRPDAATFAAFLGTPHSATHYGFDARPLWAYDLLYDLLEAEELEACLAFTVHAARSPSDHAFRLWSWRASFSESD
jgi:hypothetical protein